MVPSNFRPEEPIHAYAICRIVASPSGFLPDGFTQTRHRAATASEHTHSPSAFSATPMFTPEPGGYASGQKISITDRNPNATIRFTTDGSTPTAKSNWYHEPIVLTGSETIKAIAISTGDATSSVASASYIVH